MSIDSRVAYFTTSDGQGVGVLKPRRRVAATMEELAKVVAADIADVARLLGREPTADDLRKGATNRPGYAERNGEISARTRREAELNPKPPELSPAEAKLAYARQQEEDARRAALPHWTRMREDAERELAAAKEAEAKKAATDGIITSPEFIALDNLLADAEFVGFYDGSVSQFVLDEIRHQRALLAKTLDVATVAANVAELRKSNLAETQPERVRLKAAYDALDRRDAMFGTGVFSEAVPVLVGVTPHIRLTRNGQTVAITRERYENRVSDEALAAEVFPENANA
jgi:hypothetical protein